jgi:DNA-binding response OmpR family regulator
VPDAVKVRERVVVLDENESTRARVCAALDSAGYDATGVATAIGLRRALSCEWPIAILCDASPALPQRLVVETVKIVRSVTRDRIPIVLCGPQSTGQLAMLARASAAAGFVQRSGDFLPLLPGLHELLSIAREATVRLLLIDDSEMTLELLQRSLQDAGFDVRIALSLGEVRSIIHGWSPTVIVADVNMPDMRGDDLCLRLKTVAATRDATVILCSSLSEEDLGPLARQAGADGFVSKSVGLERCAARINVMCRRTCHPGRTFSSGGRGDHGHDQQ